MDKTARETRFNRIVQAAIVVVAVAMVIYQLIAPFQLFVGANQHQIIHISFALVLIFLVSIRRAKSRIGITLCSIYIALTIFFAAYTLPRVPWLEFYSGSVDLPLIVMVMGMLIAFLVWEGARRAMGIAIPIVCLVFLAYAYFGQYVPGIFFSGPPVELSRLFSRIGIGNLGIQGIFGTVLNVSANVTFLIFVFAALLQTTGGTRFFIEIGKWGGRRLAGGAGLTSVISSALVGMVTGTPTGNVALTGAFTIPLMKKVGYAPYQAGAIEATASTGGTIMPPIMGAVAFIMAALTGIPYIKICAMAVLPALLYFFSVGLYVQFQAVKMKARGALVDIGEQKIDFREIGLGAPLFVLPLLLIIFFLVRGFSVGYTVALAIFLLLLLSLIRKETRPSLKKLIDGLTNGAIAGSGIAAICGAAGIILGAVSFTMLIQKLPIGLMSVSGGSMLITAILAAVGSILLGMGVSMILAYIMVVLVMAPALLPLGLTVAQVHLFCLYFANIGFVTPPVAYAALVGARLAGAPYLRTAHEASKIAIAGFIVPFLILYSPALILQPTKDPLLLSILLVVGAFMLVASLQVVFCRQYFTALNRAEISVFLLIAVVVFLSFVFHSYIMIAAGLAAFSLMTAWQWRKRSAMSRVAIPGMSL